MSKNPVLYKSLVVGVIVLFIGVGINPAVAVTPDNSNNRDDCELCPKVSNQLNDELEVIINRLLSIIKYYPITDEEQQELSDSIKTIQYEPIFTCDELWDLLEHVQAKWIKFEDEGRFFLALFYFILQYPIGYWWAFRCYNP